jgi:hypothetical protein
VIQHLFSFDFNIIFPFQSAAVGTEIFNIGARATDIDAGQNNLTFNIAPYMITQVTSFVHDIKNSFLDSIFDSLPDVFLPSNFETIN